MQKAIIGKKVGMTQIFDEAGKVIPVTVVEAGPCVVIQKKTTENDGYEAVQLGFGDVTTKHVTKPMQGHFAKADVAAKKTLKEFRLADCAALNVGDVVKADTFAAGEASQSAQTEGNSRYWSGSPSGWFHGCMLLSVPYLQGQGHGRSHGC